MKTNHYLSPMFICAALAASIQPDSASVGGLDPSFGGTGKVTTAIGVSPSANGIAIQSDGRILVAGSSGDNAVLVRYNADGSLDTSFNGSGKLVGKFAFTAKRSRFSSVAVQPDGKLVAAGAAYIGSVGCDRQIM